MIQDSVNRISYDGNGIATEFAYPFSITTTNDVKVMIVDADGTETILTNDYYVDEANAKVDYPGYPAGEEPLPELQPPILATGQRIVIYRELDFTQLVSLFNQYPFKTIETMIDKATILLQQMKDAQQRALTLSVSTDTGVSLVLPAPSANKSFRWNAAGTALELTADPATVLASVQGYTELAQGYATTASEQATLASGGATTATEQANLAKDYAETVTLATQEEAEAGTDNVKRMSPLRVAQQTTARIASQTEAEAGVDNIKFMTPLRVKQCLLRAYTSAWLYDIGDGSDGAFNPSSNVTISGVKNYTSVNIPAGVTVTVNPWAVIKCQGDFIVAGTLTSVCRAGGLGGGYNGQNAGSPGQAGKYAGAGGAGSGMVGGAGGAGGGSVTTDEFGADLKSLAGLLFRIPLGLRGVGGSGGGGGKDQGYPNARGGSGGAGGGSLVVITGAVTVSGSINSNGRNGQPEQVWPGGTGGGGGGGEVLIIASSCDNPSKITATKGTGYVNGTDGFVAIYYRNI